jgi:DNA polymerase-1
MPAKKTASNTKKRLVLLDSHAIIHRAYHALPDFTSSKGEPTGALYGLSTMLLRIVTDLKPDYIVACYDLPQKTFRHEAYDGYKAGRAKTDEALVAQLQSSRNIFEAFNIPIYDNPGFEADDMLGTIVEILKDRKDIDIIIASGDMDTLQLVKGTKVQVFTLKKGLNDTILYDEEAVLQRFGFKSELLPDYKGLRGDPSDNIIGIAGIGEKTATTLITSFGTIENMYKVLKKNPEKVKAAGVTDRIIKLLEEGEEEALFSKTLATIRRDAPISFGLPEQTFHESYSFSQVESLFRELEFRSLIERVKRLFGTQQTSGSSQVSSDAAKNSSENSVASTDYNPELFKKLAIGLWLLNSDLNNITPDDVVHYQSAGSLEAAEEKIEKALKDNGLWYVYANIELPLIPIIDNMKKQGVMVDLKYLQKLSDEYHKELSALEKSIYRHAGREFNINSPKQLGEILFDEMKLQSGDGKKLKKTAGGARSTRESELEKLRDAHPIVPEIFKHRELQKLLSTYIDTIPALVGTDSRVHADFNQMGAVTGRFSSNNPNLQNIPIKTELGKNIRNAFIAPPGSVLMSFDYSQIELRLAALLSEDPYLSEIFRTGKDVHAAVASKVFGVAEKDVTHEMRRRAKVINFGILYGMGVTALRENLGTDRAEAQAFYDNYFVQFPSIRGYMDAVVEAAKEKGYTETLFGRRRQFPGLKSKIPFIKAMAERMAINAPIQGTEADIIKIGMCQAEEALTKEGLLGHIRLILQVHDELIFEVDAGYEDKAQKIITKAMIETIPETFLKGRKPVPIEVVSHTGKHWGELK